MNSLRGGWLAFMQTRVSEWELVCFDSVIPKTFHQVLYSFNSSSVIAFRAKANPSNIEVPHPTELIQQFYQAEPLRSTLSKIIVKTIEWYLNLRKHISRTEHSCNEFHYARKMNSNQNTKPKT